MRFHFHQNVRLILMKREPAVVIREESIYLGALHDR